MSYFFARIETRRFSWSQFAAPALLAVAPVLTKPIPKRRWPCAAGGFVLAWQPCASTGYWGDLNFFGWAREANFFGLGGAQVLQPEKHQGRKMDILMIYDQCSNQKIEKKICLLKEAFDMTIWRLYAFWRFQLELFSQNCITKRFNKQTIAIQCVRKLTRIFSMWVCF